MELQVINFPPRDVLQCVPLEAVRVNNNFFRNVRYQVGNALKSAKGGSALWLN